MKEWAPFVTCFNANAFKWIGNLVAIVQFHAIGVAVVKNLQFNACLDDDCLKLR